MRALVRALVRARTCGARQQFILDLENVCRSLDLGDNSQIDLYRRV